MSLTKMMAKAGILAYLLRRKLKENKGASEYMGVLVLVLIAVVVGGIMLGLFGDTIKEVWETVKTRIMDLFNYT